MAMTPFRHLRAKAVSAVLAPIAGFALIAGSAFAQQAQDAPSFDDDPVGALISELSAEPDYHDIESVVLIVATAPTVIGHEEIARALEYASEAALQFDTGDPERAAVLASLAIDSGMLTRRDLAVVYRNRGVAQVAMSDLDKAIADFTSAVTYRPDYAPGYAARAAARMRNGDFETALTDLDTALQLDPKLAAASYNRHLLHLRDGDESAAAYDLLQAHLADKENPTYAEEARALGLIH